MLRDVVTTVTMRVFAALEAEGVIPSKAADDAVVRERLYLVVMRAARAGILDFLGLG